VQRIKSSNRAETSTAADRSKKDEERAFRGGRGRMHLSNPSLMNPPEYGKTSKCPGWTHCGHEWAKKQADCKNRFVKNETTARSSGSPQWKTNLNEKKEGALKTEGVHRHNEMGRKEVTGGCKLGLKFLKKGKRNFPRLADDGHQRPAYACAGNADQITDSPVNKK